MRSNGTRYVLVVFTLLIAYFGYQWWWNPARAVKRHLGELAATLSVPANDTDLARVARIAHLRHFFADDVRIRVGAGGLEITSREALLAAVSTLRPPAGGWDVRFVDTLVKMDSGSSGRAYMMVEVTSRDARTARPTPVSIDAREASVTLVKRNGDWLITSAELREETPTRP